MCENHSVLQAAAGRKLQKRKREDPHCGETNQHALVGCMGFVWVNGFSFFHCLASPFHSFVTTSMHSHRPKATSRPAAAAGWCICNAGGPSPMRSGVATAMLNLAPTRSLDVIELEPTDCASADSIGRAGLASRHVQARTRVARRKQHRLGIAMNETSTRVMACSGRHTRHFQWDIRVRSKPRATFAGQWSDLMEYSLGMKRCRTRKYAGACDWSLAGGRAV